MQWSLNVESIGLLISGRACEPLRTQDPRVGAGCRLLLVEAPGDQRSCVGRAGGSGCSEAVCERVLWGGGGGEGGGGGGGEMATGSVTGSHASGTCKRGEEKSDTKASYKGTDPTTAGRKANL